MSESSEHLGGEEPRMWSERFELVLGDDPSPDVLADAESLIFELPMVDGYALSGDEKIRIEFIGKGTVAPAPANDDDVEYPHPGDEPGGEEQWIDEDPSRTTFVGINGATRNQFAVTVPRELLTQLAGPPIDEEADDDDFGPGDGEEGDGAPAPSPSFSGSGVGGALPSRPGADAMADPGANTDPLYGWSDTHDRRTRRYGVNAGVGGAQRWQISHGGCSGALVGPRHMITAGHCLYRTSDQQWFLNRTVRAGRNGTSARATVVLDPDNIPSGQVLWYWVHNGYLTTGQRQFDYAIITLPARIGGSGDGQAGCYDGQCWFGYAYWGNSAMSSRNFHRRGYPGCDPVQTPSGVNRVDEPCQTAATLPAGAQQVCLTIPCNPNHLYGPNTSCSPADYTNVDPDGWHRILHHGCDASSGDSGSPLYRYESSVNAWVVASVQTSQRCGATAICPSSPADHLARPLIDTRLTPEYIGWITYFRNLYP